MWTNPECKCQFRLPKLTFFRHDLSKNRVAPSEEKVAAVQNVKPPKNVAKVRSFLGLVQYCERFNLYVYGRDFELETDHKPLECIYKNTSKPSARIERWVLRLQSYSFQVVYHPGKTNIADALSRLNFLDHKDTSGEETDAVKMIAEDSTPMVLTAKEVQCALEEDPELSSVRHYIQSGDWSQNAPFHVCEE